MPKKRKKIKILDVCDKICGQCDALCRSPFPGGLAERPGGRDPLSSGSDRGLGRIATPQRPLGTFRRWKVPRRRLCIGFCQPERDTFQNPLFQPHILFSSRRKENVPLTVQEKRAARGIAIPQVPRETGECSANCPVYQTTLPPEHCRAVLARCTLEPPSHYSLREKRVLCANKKPG